MLLVDCAPVEEGEEEACAEYAQNAELPLSSC